MDDNFTKYSFNFNENSCRCTCLWLEELRTPAKGYHFASNIAVVVVNLLILIPGIVLNSLLLTAYVKNRRLHTSANMLLTVLLLSDLCVCAVAQPLYITRQISELILTFHCYIWVANRLVCQISVGVSLFIIVMISVERFVSLAYPFRYRNMITRVRVKLAISVSSALLCVFVFCQVFFPSYHFMHTIMAIFIIFCIILVIVIWLWIHRLIVRHKRQIINLQPQVSAMPSFKAVLRNTKTSYLVAGSLFVCYFPTFTTNIYYLSGFKSPTVYYYIVPWCHTLEFASSLVNPIILLYRKKDYRETVKQFLSRR